MPELSKKQMRLLSSIASGKMRKISEEDASIHKDDLKYFKANDLIKSVCREFTQEERAEHSRMGIVVIGGIIIGYEISPKGSAILYNQSKDNKRFWIGFWTNFILSITAIIISVISLLKP